MGLIELIVVLVVVMVLAIPIFAVFTDSPLGRAAARRLEAKNAPPPEVGELTRRVELLESEHEELTRQIATLKEENQFFQQLLEQDAPKLPRPPSSSSPPH